MNRINTNRKFERMFPGIAAGEKAFERDVLSHGKSNAEHNSRIIESNQINTTIHEIKGKLIGTFFFNFDTGEETFVSAI